MKSYQFIIFLGASFGILFSGITLVSLLTGNQINGSAINTRIYILSILLAIYVINIIVAFVLGKAKFVGVVSIVSSVAIIILFIPTTPSGLPVAAVLMTGGILAIVRKPR